MRSTQASAVAFLALITLLNGYQLTVQLQSLDLNGYLEDGTTKCSKLSAFGVKCYPLVAICIERMAPETNSSSTCLDGPWIELGVWPNNESITFGPTEKLRGWYNPQEITINGTFIESKQGFYVKLRVDHYYGTVVTPIAKEIWNITEFKGGEVDERNVTGGQIESFQFAWTWSGAAQTTVAPPVTQTTTTTTTTATSKGTTVSGSTSVITDAPSTSTVSQPSSTTETVPSTVPSTATGP